MHALDAELVLVSAPAASLAPALPAAERDVARLVARGLSNREIAAIRGTSTRTVANQVAAIMKKLGAASRVAIAARLGRR